MSHVVVDTETAGAEPQRDERMRRRLRKYTVVDLALKYGDARLRRLARRALYDNRKGRSALRRLRQVRFAHNVAFDLGSLSPSFATIRGLTRRAEKILDRGRKILTLDSNDGCQRGALRVERTGDERGDEDDRGVRRRVGTRHAHR